MRTIDAARGRWREILPIIGISPTFLRNRHGPCPLCGGRDRFRFDDKDGAGTYFCSQCGAGDGVTLVRKLKVWDFPTAAQEIDRILGTLQRTPSNKRSACTRTPDLVATERRLRETLRRAMCPEIVEAYLTARGITARSAALRGDTGAPFYDSDTRRLVGYFSAVMAPVVTVDLAIRSVQVIYTDPAAPERKKTMPPVGTINGASVHLFPAGEELAVAEGVENALAFHQTTGLPTWAALSAIGIEKFEPPAGLRRLVIAGDTDATFTGQAAAFNLARRMHRDRKGLEIEVRLPPDVGVDWNDLLRAGAK